MSDRRHDVRVSPLPAWVDVARLVGPGFDVRPLPEGVVEAVGALPSRAAADLAARLRGLGLAGQAIDVAIAPPLSRPLVRAARLDEARARRDTTPGFLRRGTRLDETGRFSLTPEALALEIGARVRGLKVLDACAGAGGNAIGFARSGCEVVAIELDPARARDARHNAHVYDVAPRVRVIEGDAVALVPTLEADVLFIDPPWGQAYDKRVTPLAALPLLEALLPLSARFAHVLVKVPPSFDTRALPAFRPTAVFGAADGDKQRVKLVLLAR